MWANALEEKLSEINNLQPELYREIKDSLFKKDISTEEIKKLFEIYILPLSTTAV